MSSDNTLIRILVSHGKLILLLNLILLFFAGYGMKNLYFDTDYRIFFAKDDPNLAADEKLKSIYGKADNILFVIDPADKVIFNPGVLAAIERLTELAWQIPHSRRVDSITNYQYPTVDGDDISIESFIQDSERYDAAKLEEKKQIALNEIGLIGRLISTTGETAAINVTLNLPEDAMLATEAAVTKAREIANLIESDNPGLSIYLAGIAPTEQTFSDIAAADAVTLIPAMLALVLLLLALLLRSFAATICTTIIIMVSVIVGMGGAGWLGFAINNVNISAPTIIMTLAISDCVHIFSTFFSDYARHGDKSRALKASLSLNFYPVLFTSITTMIGFLSMNFSEAPPFKELGNISAIGVLGALWGTLFLLPGLVMLLPFKATRRPPLLKAAIGPFTEFVIANHRKIFYGFLALILLSLLPLRDIELNDNPIGYFSEDTPVRQASEFIENHLSGTQVIYYSLESGKPGGALDPEFLASTEIFTNWLRSQNEVVNVESFTDIMKRLNQILHNDDQAWHRLPDEKDLAAQYFLMYELSLPYGLDPGNQVSRDKSSIKIGVTLKNQKSSGLIAFEERVQEWFVANMPQMATHGASHSLSFAHIGQRNIESMLSGSFIAMVCISLSLIFMFRSIRYGLLTFIPNLFPALVTLGIWGALVQEVNMASSVVFSLTLGIVVDDTVHFMAKYIDGRRNRGLNVEEAVRYALSTVGVAMLSTSIVLAAGFLVLALSDFTVNSTSGVMVAMTIVIAVLLDLLFFPAGLLTFSKKDEVSRRQP